jgi:hypothetical protein
MWEWREACRVLVAKPKRKRPLVKPRRRWKDNIITSLKKKRVWTAVMWFRIGKSGGLL